MKKTYLLILTLLLGISSISLASSGDEKISRATLISFKQDFKKATDVSWSETATCFKVTFNLDDLVMYAYYDKSTSELIAVTRFLLSNQLPLNLQKQLRAKLNDGWIVDLFEVAAEGDTFYYATIDNGSQKLIYKSSGYSDWNLVSKMGR